MLARHSKIAACESVLDIMLTLPSTPNILRHKSHTVPGVHPVSLPPGCTKSEVITSSVYVHKANQTFNF